MTYLHTHEGVAERFLNDIQEAVTEILENPSEDAGGSVSWPSYLFFPSLYASFTLLRLLYMECRKVFLIVPWFPIFAPFSWTRCITLIAHQKPKRVTTCTRNKLPRYAILVIENKLPSYTHYSPSKFHSLCLQPFQKWLMTNTQGLDSFECYTSLFFPLRF